MKKRNAFQFFLLAFTLMPFIFAGCETVTSQHEIHSFRQDCDNIVKIEICSYDRNKITNTWEAQLVNEDCFSPLVQLSDEDCGSLSQDILSLETKTFYMIDPILEYGDVVILIYYANNEIEMIGLTNIGWISPEGELHTSDKCFEIPEICGIISKYVDADILDDASEYFPQPSAE